MGQGSISVGQVIIGIHARLTKDGAEDIDLLVHALHDDGSPSPYIVFTNFVREEFGGSNSSLEQAFNDEVAKHSGYVVGARSVIIQVSRTRGNRADYPAR